jgi:hypothetical protein
MPAKSWYARSGTSNFDGAGHVEQVEADPRHDMENEAPGEKRLGRDAEECAHENLTCKDKSHRGPIKTWHGFPRRHEVNEHAMRA